MLHKLMTSTAFVLAGTAGAFAQELTFGRANFDYNSFSIDDTEALSTSRLNAEGEMTFDQFLLGGHFSNDVFDPDGSGELTIRSYGLSGAYILTPEALVGLGLTGINFDNGSSDEGINGFEAFGQYRTSQFGAGLTISRPYSDSESDFTIYSFVGEAEVSPGVTLGAAIETYSEIDESVYVLNAEYEQGPLFGRIYALGVTGGSSDDPTAIGLRGTYEFTDSIRTMAAYENFDFGSGTDDLSAFAIGGGYRIVEGVWIDASYGQLDGGGETADVLNISLSYEFGARTRLDRQVKQDLQEDGKIGIRSTIPYLGFGIVGTRLVD